MVLEKVVINGDLTAEVLVEAGGHVLGEGLHGEDVGVNGSVDEVHGSGFCGITKVVSAAGGAGVGVLLVLDGDLLDTVVHVVVAVILIIGDLQDAVVKLTIVVIALIIWHQCYQ